MAQLDGLPDHAATKPETEGISPKAIVATVLAGLLGIVVSVLNLVQDNPTLLGSLPAAAQTVLLVLVPPVLAAIATYQAGPGAIR